MIEKLFSLKGKVAVVTGSLGLIGKEHCRALVGAGATVLVCDLDKNGCQSFADELGDNAHPYAFDITKKAQIEELKEHILKEFGHIDVLVNNAAINDKFEDPASVGEMSKFENYPIELWSASLDVNVTGIFLCSQILGSVMAEQGNGSIINVASTYGIVAPDQSLYIDKEGNQAFFKTVAYPVTKAAVIHFTKFLAAYWGKNGVRVNTLSPGGVENNQDEFFIDKYSSKTPLGRMAKANDYQGALIYLASDASSYMTGANVVVDGGFTIW